MRKSFHAVCRQSSLGGRLLTSGQVEKVANTAGGREALMQCAFETEDAALFEAHMASAHSLKPGTLAETRDNDVHDRLPTKYVTHKPALPVKMWKAPRLTEAGKPFEPKDLEPGAVVTWRQLAPTGETYTQSSPEHGTRTVEVRDWVERSGQVWCAGGQPKSAWVVPFELHEGELAVCVRRSSLSDRLEHSATWPADGYRDAA